MTTSKTKIKVAFVKFGGLAAGGTEKFLQQIAANLPKDKFEIDYFYCDAAPYIGSDWKHPNTDPTRLQYMKDRGVNLIKFDVKYKNITVPTHDWVDTNFWEKFSEKDYDIIQTGRAGHSEYPFCKIHKTPIVDSIHLPGHNDDQPNIAAVVHISKWNQDLWISKGGNPEKAHLIYPPIEIPKALPSENYRRQLGLGDDVFIYGLHQRPDDGIFSPIPLMAYSKLSNKEKTAFVVMGGSLKYKDLADQLELGNKFVQLPFSQEVYKFLATLNVFAHGRKDGEINSQAIAEALAYGLPIVSHPGENANGHIETIGNAGVVCSSMEQYTYQLNALAESKQYYEFRASEARKQFTENYDLKTNIQKYVKLYEKVYSEIQSGKYKVDTGVEDDWLLDWVNEK